jgi:hypothetical protein
MSFISYFEIQKTESKQSTFQILHTLQQSLKGCSTKSMLHIETVNGA